MTARLRDRADHLRQDVYPADQHADRGRGMADDGAQSKAEQADQTEARPGQQHRAQYTGLAERWRRYAMRQRRSAGEERNERGDLSGGQRQGAEHRRLGCQQHRPARDHGQRGPDRPRRVLAGHHQHPEHTGQKQPGNHAGQRVVRQVTRRVPRAAADRDADGDRAGHADPHRPPGGAQGTELDPFHPGHVPEPVVPARNARHADRGHDVLPWVPLNSALPEVSVRNASSSDADRADSSATVVSASSRPAPMTIRRSAVTAISLIRWLETNTIRPSAASDFIRSRIQRMPSGSRPLTGSSNSNTPRAPRSAPALPNPRAMPRENLPPRPPPAPPQPT